MIPRLYTKLALLSFLCFVVMAGARPGYGYSRQAAGQVTQANMSAPGSPTFYDTNPFGMPGTESGVRAMSQSGGSANFPPFGPNAAASYKLLSDSPDGRSASSWGSSVGLLGLLGLLGFIRRPKEAREE